jgi:nucleotide-binding universal stress UspA family protein
MTHADTETAIVVGIAPEGRVSDGTIAFVVDTAVRLQIGVQLVHVVPTVVGGPTGAWEVGITFEQLVAQGRAGLDHALARFRERADGRVPVEATLVRGGVVATLVERSRTAQLVVLEHRHLAGWSALTSGSVTAGVAARAHAPVVSVPAGWRPRRDVRPITVAVEDAKRAASEIWTALGLAAAADLPVRLLRVAYLSQAYQELLRREVDVEDFLVSASGELERDAQLPEVVVERVPCAFEVRWGKPAEVLVEASAASSLLVMARRDPRMPLGSHLGPVVRQVLRDADCPVMVVEPALHEGATVAAATPAVTAASGHAFHRR